MTQTTTRYGRTIRAPKNEYTDRTYVAGSGFVGADHYDPDFNGGRETALGLKLEMAVEKQLYETQNDHDEMKGFIVDDDELEEIPLDESSDEEED
jgi:hypothetical protein